MNLVNPPLPVKISTSALRILAHKWLHFSEKRKLGFMRQCVTDQIGWKRKLGLLPKKSR